MPAYLRINGGSRSGPVEPSTVLDISEEGIGVRSPLPLDRDRTLAVDLDLATTRSRLRLLGQVVWSDTSGRVGLQFASLDTASAQQLREWLLLNAVAQFTGPPAAPPPSAVELQAPADPAPELFPDEHGSPISPFHEAINQLVNQAVAFTGANGAALALYQNGLLVCRATCGTDTPGLGSRISVDSGITGECLRSGRPLICNDAFNDPRVDHEVCAQLGVRSILAVPLQVGENTVGLLEAFSPRLAEFVPLDAEAILQSSRPVLDLLFAGPSKPVEESRSIDPKAALAPITAARELQEQVAPAPTVPVAHAPEPLQPPRLPVPEYSEPGPYRRAAYLAAAIAIIVAVSWIIVTQGSTLASLFRPKPKEVSAPVIAAADQEVAKEEPPAPVSPESTAALNLLKRQAAQGDAAAQFSLGAKYAAGEDGLKQDYPEAVRWFTKSADQGHTLAQATLGAFYWAGRGVPADLQQAYMWSLLADAGGDKGSKYRLEVLRQRMTSTEVVLAGHLAQDWRERHKHLQGSSKPPAPLQ